MQLIENSPVALIDDFAYGGRRGYFRLLTDMDSDDTRILALLDPPLSQLRSDQ